MWRSWLTVRDQRRTGKTGNKIIKCDLVIGKRLSLEDGKNNNEKDLSKNIYFILLDFFSNIYTYIYIHTYIRVHVHISIYIYVCI